MDKLEPENRDRTRILWAFAIIVMLFCALILRTAYHQIIKGEEYSRKAVSQQTDDKVITAMRGNILDCSGHPIAISDPVYTVWVRPAKIADNGETTQQKSENVRLIAKNLSEILSMDYDDVLSQITSDRNLFRLAKNQEKETVNKIREVVQNNSFQGIEITEGTKRSYPLKNFASRIIGSTSDDNVGITGLEYYYNELLSGTDGRWISSTDVYNNTIVFGKNKYYSSKDGFTLVTTIDSNVQRVTEEIIEKYKEKFEAEKVLAIIMEVETGEIVAMAQTDGYDLNNPRVYRGENEEEFLNMSDAEKTEYWNTIWRNSCISDVYEPGSTFKPITVAMALDYGVTSMDEWFYCEGYKDVEDWTIHCWNWPWIHGSEDLTHAVVNSCNSVMIELEQRIGRTNYYNGLRTFCVTNKTDIDFPGEASNIIYKEKSAGPVERATMSFGQGIAVTPISLITALSSLANDGKLMQPHFVKQIQNGSGKVLQNIEPVVKNITVSKETADNMLSIFEAVVTDGGAGNAAIPGYRVGGKTGTAYKASEGGYSEAVDTSFIGIVPIDDPKYSVLVVFDSPNIDSSTLTAGACEREIMEQLLLIKNVAPEYSDAEIAAINLQKVEVPDLKGQTLDDAYGMIAGKGLNCIVSSDPGEGYSETIVTDQYPKAGTLVDRNTNVTVYYK